MDFIELAKQRYSCRNYKDIPVEEEKILKVLEAGRIAPSAANRQPWIFYVVSNAEKKINICSAYKRDWIKTAPVLLIICGDHSGSWKRSDGKDHCDIDIAIAVDHITLQATESGLATCWICNFDAVLCSEILKLPAHIEPMVILSLGYPADSVNPGRHDIQRKPAGEISVLDF